MFKNIYRVSVQREVLIKLIYMNLRESSLERTLPEYPFLKEGDGNHSASIFTKKRN